MDCFPKNITNETDKLIYNERLIYVEINVIQPFVLIIIINYIYKHIIIFYNVFKILYFIKSQETE